jgi:hypothetical protein
MLRLASGPSYGWSCCNTLDNKLLKTMRYLLHKSMIFCKDEVVVICNQNTRSSYIAGKSNGFSLNLVWSRRSYFYHLIFVSCILTSCILTMWYLFYLILLLLTTFLSRSPSTIPFLLAQAHRDPAKSSLLFPRTTNLFPRSNYPLSSPLSPERSGSPDSWGIGLLLSEPYAPQAYYRYCIFRSLP